MTECAFEWLTVVQFELIKTLGFLEQTEKLNIHRVDFSVGFTFGLVLSYRIVASYGLKWTQLDRSELMFGHNLDTV